MKRAQGIALVIFIVACVAFGFINRCGTEPVVSEPVPPVVVTVVVVQTATPRALPIGPVLPSRTPVPPLILDALPSRTPLATRTPTAPPTPDWLPTTPTPARSPVQRG